MLDKINKLINSPLWVILIPAFSVLISYYNGYSNELANSLAIIIILIIVVIFLFLQNKLEGFNQKDISIHEPPDTKILIIFNSRSINSDVIRRIIDNSGGNLIFYKFDINNDSIDELKVLFNNSDAILCIWSPELSNNNRFFEIIEKKLTESTYKPFLVVYKENESNTIAAELKNKYKFIIDDNNDDNIVNTLVLLLSRSIGRTKHYIDYVEAWNRGFKSLTLSILIIISAYILALFYLKLQNQKIKNNYDYSSYDLKFDKDDTTIVRQSVEKYFDAKLSQLKLILNDEDLKITVWYLDTTKSKIICSLKLPNISIGKSPKSLNVKDSSSLGCFTKTNKFVTWCKDTSNIAYVYSFNTSSNDKADRIIYKRTAPSDNKDKEYSTIGHGNLNDPLNFKRVIFLDTTKDDKFVKNARDIEIAKAFLVEMLALIKNIPDNNLPVFIE